MAPGARNLHVALAESADEREAVYRFRARAAPANPAIENGRWCDELDDVASHFYVTQHGKVIGSMRMLAGDAELPEKSRVAYQLDRFSGFQPGELAITSRITIDPDWEDGQVLAVLFAAGYNHGRRLGVQFNFSHCSPALTGLYEQIGYRRYVDTFMDDSAGFQVPMVLLMEDVEHLRAVRSPLLSHAAKWPNRPNSALWFGNTFPAHRFHFSERRMSTDDFWQLLSEKLHDLPFFDIPLLDGLNEAEAKRFLGLGTILRAHSGDTIIRPGDSGSEMYMILSGMVEVFGRREDHLHSLATFGPGQVFGEIAFVSNSPRTAYVIGQTDLEILVLTPQFLRGVMKSEPEITAKVLLNLSLILCERLRTSTENWLSLVAKREDDDGSPRRADL